MVLTVSGINEVERHATPESRQERRRSLLRAVYRLADGDPTEYVY
jgi:hypothetical protein